MTNKHKTYKLAARHLTSHLKTVLWGRIDKVIYFNGRVTFEACDGSWHDLHHNRKVEVVDENGPCRWLDGLRKAKDSK